MPDAPFALPSDPLKAAKAAEAGGRLAEAERLCREAIKGDPGDASARVLCARIMGRAGKPDSAMAYLREALALDPGNSDALEALSGLYRYLGRAQEALATAQELVARHPESPVGHVSMGRTQLATFALGEAQLSFEKATRLDPTDALAGYYLGESLYLQGRNAEAVTHFREALNLDPNLVQARLRLAKLLLLAGDRSGAIAECESALQSDNKSAEAHVIWAEALQELNEQQEAERHLTIASEIDPGSGVSHGFRLQVLGRFDEAQRAFEAALRTDPRAVRAFQGLVAGKKVGPADRALIIKMASLAKDPQLPPRDGVTLHFALGKAHDDLGEFEVAMQHFIEGNRCAKEYFNLRFDREHLRSVNDDRIATYSRSTIEHLSAHGSESETPLLVVGMIRSGTTLIEQALSSHPDIAPGGELRYWSELESGFNQMVRDGTVTEEAARGAADDYLRLLQQIGTLEAGNPASPCAARVIDKMPLNYNFLGLIHSVFPKAKIIHCKRNPMANVFSIYTTFFDTPPPFAHDPANIIFYYREYERLMDHWKTVIPTDCLLEVSYEAFVADRERVARGIVEFAGLDWNDAVLHHQKNSRAVRTPSVWQVRQSVYTSSLEKWRNYRPWLGAFWKMERHEPR